MKNPTIAEAAKLYIKSLQISRSDNTRDTYGFAMRAFTAMLVDKDINPETTPVSALEEEAVSWFSAELKKLSPATEKLYLQATVGFYEFIAAERLHSPNLPRLRLLVRQRGRRAGQRLPQFPRDDIEKVLEHVQVIAPSSDPNEQLRSLRDAAFLLNSCRYRTPCPRGMQTSSRRYRLE